MIISPTDQAILADSLEADHMPFVVCTGQLATVNHPWMYAVTGYQGQEVEGLMQYIMAKWDYAAKGRKPRIGHAGWTLSSTDLHQIGMERMLQWYPDKFEWMGLERAPVGTAAWAVEVDRLKNCDYIHCSMVGSTMAAFIKEARLRGYTGAFIGTTSFFPGFWSLVEGAVSVSQLCDCFHSAWWPWWSDNVPVINSLKAATQEPHTGDAAERMKNSGPISGWLTGMITADAIVRAVQSVGAENVDGPAIRDALRATDMTPEGFGNPWRYTDDFHGLCRTLKIFHYNMTTRDWEETDSGWITPRSLQ